MDADHSSNRAILKLISFICAISLFAAACGEPKKDPGNAVGKKAIMDKVNSALTAGDCKTALSEISPLYNSAATDNDVRMLAASVYACHAGISLFKLIGDLGANSSLLTGGGFWGLLAKLFPSDPLDPNDRIMESTELATDALFSVLKSGQVIPTSVITNSDTFNPGSMVYSDRLDPANTFLVFVSMAQIGAIENRYGAPDPTDYKKTKDLKWTTATTVDADGCAYASALVNFVDALGATADAANGSLKTSLTNLRTAFAAGVFGACRTGCNNAPGPYVIGADSPTGVPTFLPIGPTGFTKSNCTATPNDCSGCPTALRDRTKCKALTNDLTSCAAAGIVNFINSTPTVGWETH